jgi:hypothetical protein
VSYPHSHGMPPQLAGWGPGRLWAHLTQAHGVRTELGVGMDGLVATHDQEHQDKAGTGADRIARERATHEERGYTLEHDQQGGPSHLLEMAVERLAEPYALVTDHDLVVAGALIAAELNRRAAR